MKKYTHTPFLIGLLLTSILSFHCKKNDVELPPITQSGKNTFACKINGVNWIPYWQCFSGGSIAALQYYIFSIDSNSKLPLHFAAEAANSNNGYVIMMQQGAMLSDHIYGPGNIIDSIDITCLGPINEYYKDQTQNGTSDRYFTITKLDTVNDIISGIFSFTLYGSYGSTNDSLVLTEGRFDFKIGSYYDCSQ